MTLHTSLLLASVLAFTSLTNGYTPPSANCKNFTIPVHVNSDNYAWVAPKWTDNYGLIDFVTTASSRTDAGFPSPFGNTTSQEGTYEIGATFCTPKQSNEKTSTVLLATHGAGYDRGYWNSPYKPDQYNFVQYATQKGYSVFFYDRLGIGSSSKISGFVSQLSIQVSVLSSLISTVRSGNFTLLSGAPKSIVLVGHSFGSYVSNSLVATEPTAVDGVILTGDGVKGLDIKVVLEAFTPRVANLYDPKFAALDAGYVVSGDLFGTINNFFKAPDYEHDVAMFSDSTKQPLGIPELLSLSLADLNASAFKGPALVISGEYDFIACGGYCPGELEPSFAPLFSGSKTFETYIQPLSGHGTNFAKNATGFYGVIFDYLARTGL